MQATRKNNAAKTHHANVDATYAHLPKHLTTWPLNLTANGHKGFTTPAQWIEEHVNEFGIRSLQKLHEHTLDGSIPSIELSLIGELSGYMDVGGKRGEMSLIAHDPADMRPRLPKLRAVAYINTNKGVVTIPTGIEMDLYESPELRVVKIKSALTKARDTAQHKGLVRLAWQCEHDGKIKVRHVEYHDKDDASCVPKKNEDMESAVADIEHVAVYSEDNLRNDIAARARSIIMAGIRAPAARTDAPVATTEHPEPAHKKPILPAYSDNNRAMKATREFNPAIMPNADSAHVVTVSSSSLNSRINNAVDGVIAVHAGIISNYAPFFPAGHGKGIMTPGAQVLIGITNGDTVTIVARAPYAGIRPGENGAAQLRILVDQIVELEQPVAFSKEENGIGNINGPFAISRTIDKGGFQVPAQARINIWKTVHGHMGWDTGESNGG